MSRWNRKTFVNNRKIIWSSILDKNSIEKKKQHEKKKEPNML